MKPTDADLGDVIERVIREHGVDIDRIAAAVRSESAAEIARLRLDREEAFAGRDEAEEACRNRGVEIAALRGRLSFVTDVLDGAPGASIPVGLGPEHPAVRVAALKARVEEAERERAAASMESLRIAHAIEAALRAERDTAESRAHRAEALLGYAERFRFGPTLAQLVRKPQEFDDLDSLNACLRTLAAAGLLPDELAKVIR